MVKSPPKLAQGGDQYRERQGDWEKKRQGKGEGEKGEELNGEEEDVEKKRRRQRETELCLKYACKIKTMKSYYFCFVLCGKKTHAEIYLLDIHWTHYQIVNRRPVLFSGSLDLAHLTHLRLIPDIHSQTPTQPRATTTLFSASTMLDAW